MEQEIVCANCGITIRWASTIVEEKVYCCPGCAQGGPCDCDYDSLLPPGSSNPIVVQGEDGALASWTLTR
jgi:hypothetical protein